MAIIISAKNPQAILADIKAEIDVGKITTWQYDADGDFTHSPEQWKYKAWLSPEVTDNELIFAIMPPRDRTISRTVYAVYHGRFIEMLLTHFDERFSLAKATALPARGDQVKG